MSWSATVHRVRDSSRPVGQRVSALHSLLANHHAPLGFERTRQRLRTEVGVTGRQWTEAQLLHALTLLEESRATHLAYGRAWARRRALDKADGRRQSTRTQRDALSEEVWLKDPRTVEALFTAHPQDA